MEYNILDTLSHKKDLPLYGVKVLEFSNAISASMTTMILGDLGAIVIRIYCSDLGDPDTPYRAVIDRNKYCLDLNLNKTDDLKKALELVKNSDVVVENFRPQSLKNKGIDFVELQKSQPQTIFLSMPGFASNDEKRSSWKATEEVLAASSGVYTDMGLNRVLMGINPSFSPLPLASTYGSVLASYAVISALYHRQKTGLGDVIEVPLSAALLEALCYNSIDIDGNPERYKCYREKEIEYRKNNNIPMNLSYDEVMDLIDPFFKIYYCKDDRPIYLVALGHINHSKRCLQAMGIYDELVEMGLPDVEDVFKPISEWEAETTIKVYPIEKKWADIITAKLKKTFLTKTASEWEKIFGEIGVPGAKHRSLKEWIHDKHAHQTNLIIKSNDVKYGDMLQMGPIVWSEDIVDTITQPKSRQFINYEQAQQLFSTPSMLRDNYDEITGEEKWMDGVKILDLTNVIAGPHSAYCMQRFGAEIIKLDTVKPKYDPFNFVIYALNQGRGKRSILVDKNTEKGKEIFEKLVKDVDIVLINAVGRQLADLGLDDASLKKINPNIIFCCLDCFGGAKIGERSDYIGYDDLVQATVGIQERFGGSLTRPEEHAHVGTIDVVCGFSASVAMAMALYCRERKNEYKRVKTSLSALGNLLQVKYCYDYAGRGDFDEPRGPDIKGYNDFSRFYEASDNFIFLDIQNYTHLAEQGFPGFNDADDKFEFLSQTIKQDTAQNWTDKLQGIGIPASPTNNIIDIRNEYCRDNDFTSGVENGSYSFTRFKDHPSNHIITQVDPYAIRPMRAKVNFVNPTEKFGSSTVSIMQEYGYSDAEINSMIENGEIGVSWGKEYIPS